MPTNTDTTLVSLRGGSWGDNDKDSKARPVGRAMILGVALGMVLALFPLGSNPEPEDANSWIVRSVPGQSQSVAALLAESGAAGISPLPIIDGFVADMTSSMATRVRAAFGVLSVTPDASIELSSFESGPPSDGGSLARIVDHVIGADAYWEAGFTGAGVDVAIIDSGISPVPGLTGENKVVNGPDISFDSPQPNLHHLDLFGHGTHMASIIAGSDLETGASPSQPDFRTSYMGIAPNARLVSVKVADGQGLADVSQVIAALDWIVAHQEDSDRGLDIRVLGLAFGTDGTQSPAIDPLAFAVEQAWNSGIAVVISSGNDGNSQPLRNPALHPSIIAVGGVDSRGTYASADDQVLPFSNCGIGRTVDLVAPGKSVLGLRVPGSGIDVHNSSAVVQDRLFRGSGTSQASAIVTGAVALIIDQRPDITPDEVKALLQASARPLRKVSSDCQGAGLIDLEAALSTPTPEVVSSGPFSTGRGTLDGARGTHHVQHDGVVLQGEIDIFGNAWDGSSSPDFFAGASWSGASWSGASWSGASWSGASWSGASWSGASWSGASWSGASWS
ncbi:MAG: S8 family serine peptidase, partial [Acidimicrobiia bacterium]